MGPLQELPACRMTATDEERTAGTHHRGDKRAPQHEPERRFLCRVARRIALGAQRQEFEGLVLMGPPRALGLLKAALPAEIVARIEATDPHERRQEDPAALRHHLGEARARRHGSPQAEGSGIGRG
jgi:hypothetical protein